MSAKPLEYETPPAPARPPVWLRVCAAAGVFLPHAIIWGAIVAGRREEVIWVAGICTTLLGIVGVGLWAGYTCPPRRHTWHTLLTLAIALLVFGLVQIMLLRPAQVFFD